MLNGLNDVTNTPTLIVGGVLAVATAPVWLPIAGVWGLTKLVAKAVKKKCA